MLPRGPRDLAWQILLFCGAYKLGVYVERKVQAKARAQQTEAEGEQKP